MWRYSGCRLIGNANIGRAVVENGVILFVLDVCGINPFPGDLDLAKVDLHICGLLMPWRPDGRRLSFRKSGPVV
jgi:dihydropteroate synthase